MEKASKATWKKQRNMKKATQHEKSNATWKKQRNMESTATRKRQNNKDHENEEHDKRGKATQHD